MANMKTRILLSALMLTIEMSMQAQTDEPTVIASSPTKSAEYALANSPNPHCSV